MRPAIAILLMIAACCPKPAIRPAPEPRVAEAIDEMMVTCRQTSEEMSCPRGTVNRMVAAAMDCGEALDKQKVECWACTEIGNVDRAALNGQIVDQRLEIKSLQSQRWYFAAGAFVIGVLATGIVASRM